jgi:hypothetical protein
VFVYTPMREDKAFVFVPVVAPGVEHRLVRRPELLLTVDLAAVIARCSRRVE